MADNTITLTLPDDESQNGFMMTLTFDGATPTISGADIAEASGISSGNSVTVLPNSATITITGDVKGMELEQIPYTSEYYSDHGKGTTALADLNVSGNPLLEKLVVKLGTNNRNRKNSQTTLDLTNNVNLKELELSYFNDLTSIDLSKNTNLESFTWRSVSSDYLPNWDLDFSNNTQLKYLEIDDPYNGSGIKGINVEQCKDLETLDVDFKSSTAFEIGSLPKLKNLKLQGIKSISFGSTTGLESIIINSDKLTSIDLSAQTNLNTLNLYCSGLTSVDLTANKALKTLSVTGKETSSISLPSTETLEKINIDAPLTSLNVSSNTGLRELSLKTTDANHANLTSLDLSKNTALTSLVLSSTTLSSLDITKNTALKKLSVYTPLIARIDLTKNTEITTAYISAPLTALDISKNSSLNSLELNGIAMTSYSPSNSNLTTLKISDAEKMTSFSGASVAGLTSLSINDCDLLKTVNLTKNTALTALDMSRNDALANVDLTALTALVKLDLSYDPIKTLDLSKNTELTDLHLQKCQLTTLDLTNVTKLLPNDDSIIQEHTDMRWNDQRVTATILSGGKLGVEMNADAEVSRISSLKVNDVAMTPEIVEEGGKKYLVVGTTSDIPSGKVEFLYFTNTTQDFYDAKYLRPRFFFTGGTGAVNVIKFKSNKASGEQIQLIMAGTGNVVFDGLDGTPNIKSTGYTKYTLTTDDIVTITGDVSSIRFGGSYSDLVSLDVSGSTSLHTLDCSSSSHLTSLKINEDLETLTCSSCTSLTSIELPDFKSLSTNMQLTSLNCNGCSSLASLPFDSRFENLKTLNCANCTALTEIKNLQALKALTTLDCHSSSSITSLDVSKNENLTTLTANNMTALKTMTVNGATALQKLTCYSNTALTSLDVSECKALTSLDCKYNSALSSLNVNGATALSTLNCYGCGMTTLDVLGAPALTELTCSNCNALETLNVDGLKKLKKLTCGGNSAMKTLTVSNCTALDRLDCNGLKALTTLNVNGATSMTYLTCTSCTALETIDVSGCTALKTLYCYNNDALKNLNAHGATALQEISCHTCKLLETLDLSECSSVKTLNTSECPALLTLNLKDATGLTSLNCYKCVSLQDLDLTNCTALTKITANNCSTLPTLDVSTCTALTTLNCSAGTKMTTLKLSGAENLKELQCTYMTSLPEINVSDNAKLEKITCNYCPLIEELDFRSNPVLTQIYCSNCSSLSAIQLEGADALTRLECNNCPSLGELDVTMTKVLNTLYCKKSALTSLNVKDVTTLEYLYTSDNPDLGKLDVSTNVNLKTLECESCGLKTIDLTTNTKLTHLYCRYNELTSLDINHLTSLAHLRCGRNQLMELYIPALTKLNNGGASDYVGVSTQYKELPATIMNKKVAVPIVAAANVEKITALKVSKNGRTAYSIDTPEFITDSRGNNYLVISDDEELPRAGSKVTYKYITDNTQYHATEMSVELTITGMPGTITFTTNKPVGEKVKLKVAYAGEIILSGVTETLEPHNGGWEEEIELTVAATGEDPEPELHTISLYGGISTFKIQQDMGVTALDVTNAPDLWTLYCQNNNLIKKLDLTKSTGLRYLDVQGVHSGSRMEGLTSIDVRNCTELVSLSIADAKLSSIDVSKNTKLTHLNLMYNNLYQLKVDQLTELTDLSITDNKITALDLSKNTKLTDLTVDDNKIKTNGVATIDLSNNPNIARLYAQGCDFTTLDVTGLTELETLWLNINKLEQLDVTNNTKLGDLMVMYNDLQSLDVSKNEELYRLELDRNQNLGEIDVTNNPALKTLWAEGCGLDEIYVAENPALEDLRVSRNNLYELDVTHNGRLNKLHAYSNHLTALDLQYNAEFEQTYRDVDLHGQTRDIVPELKKIGDYIYVAAPISKTASVHSAQNIKVNGNAVDPTLVTDIISGEDNSYLLMARPTKDLHYGADTKIKYDYNTKTPSELFQWPEGKMDVTLTMQNAHVQMMDAEGYGTLYLDYPAAVPEGAEVYYVSSDCIDFDNEVLTINKAENKIEGTVPEETAFITKFTPGAFVLFNYSDDTPAVVSGNIMEGTTVDKEYAGDRSILTLGHEKTSYEYGFWRYTGSKIYAWRSWIPLATIEGLIPEGSKGFSLAFTDGTETEKPSNGNGSDEQTTGIQDASDSMAIDGDVYDLTGKRVATAEEFPMVKNRLQRGVYIVNGKKMVIK